MRKESLTIAKAFLARKPARAARTTTDGKTLFLHGNPIAWHNEDGSLSLTLAGWETVTTRDRLNTVCRLIGYGRFSQLAHSQFFNGEAIQSDDVIKVNTWTLAPY